MPMSRLCTGTSVMSLPSNVLVASSSRIAADVIICHPEATGRGIFPVASKIPRYARDDTALRLGSTSALQDLGDARVDVVFAGVVPFPVGLDQACDLGLGGE